ncbi:general odorant-binding protein 84a [Drosophila grimshawi]|uniref:GH19282 n=1 Tax=Drosophila grimshawi TaxID=7222 RepID=B4JFA9_DROGR|nr:general odorant-binding protein 84a [Drosophila grimshawi]EDV93390.1 GH19282 [Drosophila grimshawi]
MFSKFVISVALLILLSLSIGILNAIGDRAKDNGDIFIINYDNFDGDVDDISTTTQVPREEGYIDMDEIVHVCNTSFITPLSVLQQFNTTGKLLDETDRTSMCFIRCFFEKTGILDNYKLNVDLVRKYMWPATGDSIEYCEAQGKDEVNPCIRIYVIIQCCMIRALTDARNKPMV